MKKKSKATLLGGLLWEDPTELADRLITFADFQRDRLRRKATLVPLSQPDFLHKLSETLREDVGRFFQEPGLHEITQTVADGLRQLNADAAFGMCHAADASLAHLCYALCRLQKPMTVVETGVAHGVTTAFLLQALAENGQGELWSIDLPPLAEGANDQVGCLVPVHLRSRWHLLRGRTHRVLPKLASRLSSVDIFLHDSLHTYRNILMEFRTVWAKLPAGGLIISDDVELNRAFENFVHRSGVAAALTCHEHSKASVMGVIVKSQNSGAK